MNKTLRRSIVIALVVVISFVFEPKPAEAQGVSGGQAAAIFATIAVVGAVIGVGTYYAIRHTPSITGCAVSGGGGMTLVNEGDHETFLLVGDVAGVKEGDRVKVRGRKKKETGKAGEPRTFVVEQLRKDYGVCKAVAAGGAGTP